MRDRDAVGNGDQHLRGIQSLSQRATRAQGVRHTDDARKAYWPDAKSPSRIAVLAWSPTRALSGRMRTVVALLLAVPVFVTAFALDTSALLRLAFYWAIAVLTHRWGLLAMVIAAIALAVWWRTNHRGSIRKRIVQKPQSRKQRRRPAAVRRTT
jgi:hypothetical protein